MNTGKHYVGSASGNSNGLWQRWVHYANGDHTGGDVDLIALVNGKGKEYIEEHFQYSILEIFDTRVDFDSVHRERTFGNVHSIAENMVTIVINIQ